MANIDRLLEIMATLRDPSGGCPWDREQDFDTISPFTIEEAYEVDDAIARGDTEALRDELGDLLFQVVFQARIGEEKGLFDFEGVAEAICDKLVRRHPHVFAEADAPGSLKAQLQSWEEIKAAERAAAGQGDDPFAGVPRSLPALARSAKIAGRLERSEETRATSQAPLAVLRGVLDRLEGASEPDGEPEAAREIGEGLRAWVRLARTHGVDPEQALREADDAVVAEVRAARAARQAGDAPTR